MVTSRICKGLVDYICAISGLCAHPCPRTCPRNKKCVWRGLIRSHTPLCSHKRRGDGGREAQRAAPLLARHRPGHARRALCRRRPRGRAPAGGCRRLGGPGARRDALRRAARPARRAPPAWPCPPARACVLRGTLHRRCDAVTGHSPTLPLRVRQPRAPGEQPKLRRSMSGFSLLKGGAPCGRGRVWQRRPSPSAGARTCCFCMRADLS